MQIRTFKTLSTFVLALCLAITLSAQIPKLISYQGFLTDNNGQALANGTYNVSVKIFDAATGGNELWSETHNVNLTNGLFSVALGSNNALNLAFDQAYFVSTTVDGTELLPRTAMTASPYALNAGATGKPYALDALGGGRINVVYVDTSNRVGIGTSRPLDGFVDLRGDTRNQMALYSRSGYGSSTDRRIGVLGHASGFDFDTNIAASIMGDISSGTTTRSFSDTLVGVQGMAFGANRYNIGLQGVASGQSANSIGVLGSTVNVENGSSDKRSYAIFGENKGLGWAGYFVGNGYFSDVDLVVEGGSNVSARQARSAASSLYVESSISNPYGLYVTNSVEERPFNQSTYGLFSEAAGSQGIGGFFRGSKSGIEAISVEVSGVGGYFEGGLAGIRAKSSEENGLAADFDGTVEVRKSGTNGALLLEGGDQPLIAFNKGNSSFFMLRRANDMVFTGQDIKILDNLTIGSQSSYPNHPLAIDSDGSQDGLVVRIRTNTDADNKFIRFEDSDGDQGAITGSTSFADLDLGGRLASFFTGIFVPKPNAPTTAKFELFPAVDENWSGSTGADKTNDINSADTGDFGTVLANFTGDRVNVEFLIESILLSIDVAENAVAFASSFGSVLDPEDIFSTGLDLVISGVNLGVFLGYAIAADGVAYNSGAGDYAEWLIRADSNETITFGDVVGLRAGEISTNFLEADHFMAISTAPAVVGATPAAAKQHLYEKVAFMGQVPVKVRGIVNKGDYIVPSGDGDGLGIAVNPKDMLAKDYHRIVGIAWDSSDGKEMFQMINTAVGINQNDLAGMVDQLQVTVNAMQLALKELNPDFEVNLFTTSGRQNTQQVSDLGYTVSSSHASKTQGLFGGQQFNNIEEAKVAIKDAWTQTAQLDLEQNDFLTYMLEHPEEAPAMIEHYTGAIQQLQSLAKQVTAQMKGDD